MLLLWPFVVAAAAAAAACMLGSDGLLSGEAALADGVPTLGELTGEQRAARENLFGWAAIGGEEDRWSMAAR